MIADVIDWTIIFIGGEEYKEYRECPVCYAIVRDEKAVEHRLWHLERRNPESLSGSLDRLLRETEGEDEFEPHSG